MYRVVVTWLDGTNSIFLRVKEVYLDEPLGNYVRLVHADNDSVTVLNSKAVRYITKERVERVQQEEVK